MAFTFDTTLGVALALPMHKLLVRAAKARLAAASTAAEPPGAVMKRSWAATIAACGDYGALRGREAQQASSLVAHSMSTLHPAHACQPLLICHCCRHMRVCAAR